MQTESSVLQRTRLLCLRGDFLKKKNLETGLGFFVGFFFFTIPGSLLLYLNNPTLEKC